MQTSISSSDVAYWRDKMPAAFREPLAVRLRRNALFAAFAALFGWCLYDFGFSPSGSSPAWGGWVGFSPSCFRPMSGLNGSSLPIS